MKHLQVLFEETDDELTSFLSLDDLLPFFYLLIICKQVYDGCELGASLNRPGPFRMMIR